MTVPGETPQFPWPLVGQSWGKSYTVCPGTWARLNPSPVHQHLLYWLSSLPCLISRPPSMLPRITLQRDYFPPQIPPLNNCFSGNSDQTHRKCEMKTRRWSLTGRREITAEHERQIFTCLKHDNKLLKTGMDIYFHYFPKETDPYKKKMIIAFSLLGWNRQWL